MTYLATVPLPIAPVGSPGLLAIGALLLAVALLLAGWLLRRGRVRTGSKRRPGTPAVRVAALAAAGCTAYSADTSWRFAADYLDMGSTAERAAMFAAAELALFATALMARQNLNSPRGTPGLPGVLVWVITGVQAIPAFAESGPVGGTVRAFVGPIMAAMLWHQAMGIELRLHMPEAASHGVLASAGREVRERLLSRIGIAERNRDAAQITRDRATVRAVALATRLADRTPKRRGNWRGRRIARRLSVAIARAAVGTDPQQRHALLLQLAARRHATALATVNLPSPWTQFIPDEEADSADQTAPHTPLPRQQAGADQATHRLRAVPTAGPQTDRSSVGDRPDGYHTGPSQLKDGDQHPVPDLVPDTRGAQPSAGDRPAADDSGPADGTSPRATEDTDSVPPEHGDRPRPVPGTYESTGHAAGTAEYAGEEGALGTVPGTASVEGPSAAVPVPVPEDGDRDQTGTVPGTDTNGDRPQPVPANDDEPRPHPVPKPKPKGKGDRSRNGRGRQPRLSEDEIVARIRPHVPAVLERDGNSDITRVQLRQIMRAQRISIRNEHLSPVLQRLRSETGSKTRKRSSAR
ncbi:hypothetical protein OG607_41770 [Streptomyces sp. NBC_01537]|uniref:hypothetical protein n=1 Tax=Streptomyces sp. NBC_01537 TaxID=2903896 RepID=UPI00386EE850